MASEPKSNLSCLHFLISADWLSLLLQVRYANGFGIFVGTLPALLL